MPEEKKNSSEGIVEQEMHSGTSHVVHHSPLPQAAQYIGCGLCTIALFGVAIGVGNIFSSAVQAIARNPQAKGSISTIAMLGAALVEATGLFALVAFFLMFFKS